MPPMVSASTFDSEDRRRVTARGIGELEHKVAFCSSNSVALILLNREPLMPSSISVTDSSTSDFDEDAAAPPEYVASVSHKPATVWCASSSTQGHLPSRIVHHLSVTLWDLALEFEFLKHIN